MRVLVQIGLVSLGSALGGLARWGITLGAARLLRSFFPWGTFFINISGSLFLGWFTTVLSEKLVLKEGAWLRKDDLHLLIAVGFTGAYTTFSTFEYETQKLLKDNWLMGTIYMTASVLLGLLAVRLGVLLAGGK